MFAVAIQTPNFLGSIEDGGEVSEALSALPHRPLLIASVEPVSLALLAPPRSYGADVAVGDGQGLGNEPFFGGPTFGFFATRMARES